MPLEHWLSFCSIALLATATPGPAALLVSIHSATFGFKQTLATVLGNVTSLLIMSSVSVIGLTALVVHSAVAFSLVKILGAAYLIYMGIKLWRSGIQFNTPTSEQPVKANLLGLYGQGLLVAITNPKAILFTTALFPQFIDVTEPLLAQFSILVSSFMLLSFVCLSSYSILVHRASQRFNQRLPGRLLGRLFGGTFICAGIGTGMSTGFSTVIEGAINSNGDLSRAK
ncbi:lysine transporter LysE [Bacterioplanes sanyensis]|uniref:Lysine transporter LysE n=1 Tax=Bacterioplanes sanyensis TaxID=1249553 RepID=A0A222FIE9_9GAMM|nr:LysE family translocator [Bacterioplanes sanyensis]ASP38827.1 lysine transporter LysE [Bacterioplanes sanyensis]